ncbi:MAG: hypothetical protein ACNA8W_23345, partial [Bradymonadaceae bacterium]
MTMRNFLVPLLGVGLIGAACSATDVEDIPPGSVSSTGMALIMDYLGDSDVKGFHYIVTSCGGYEPVVDKKTDLEDLTLPGMIPFFDNKPLDSHSKHLFADHFMVLPAGCYDVKVVPLASKKEPSKDCARASARGVEVFKGLTTEILVVSQCKGPE